MSRDLSHHIISEGTVLDAMTDATNWSASDSGTVVAATAPDGSPCLLHTTASGTKSDLVKSLTHAPSAGITVDVWCKNPVSAAAANARFLPFQYNNIVSDYVQGGNNRVYTGGWHRVILQRHQRRDGGAGAVADSGIQLGGTGHIDKSMSTIMLRTREQTSTQVQVYYKNLRTGVKTKPARAIRIDDGHASVPSFQAILDDFGLKATLFVIPSFVGTANYMTWAQIDAWVDAGHEIANHTWSHQQNVLPSASVAVCRAEIEQAADALIARYGDDHPNVFPFILAQPYGERGVNYDQALDEAGIVMALNAGLTEHTGAWSLCGCNKHYHTYIVGGTTGTVQTDLARIEDGACRGGVFVLGLHRYVAGSPSIDTELGDARTRQLLGKFANEQDSVPVYKIGGELYPFLAAQP